METLRIGRPPVRQPAHPSVARNTLAGLLYGLAFGAGLGLGVTGWVMLASVV